MGVLAVIGLQIAYPLVHGNVLRDITLATVFVGAATMVFHSYLVYGPLFATTFTVVTFAYSLGIETLGVKSGWPFGRYQYDHSLGFQIFGVPLLVPFAWMMLSYPLLVASRRAAARWVFIYGGIGLMIWDLFLDPQMVDAGRWSWKLVGPHTPFEPRIPLSNSAGWLFAGMGLMALLQKFYPTATAEKRSIRWRPISCSYGRSSAGSSEISSTSITSRSAYLWAPSSLFISSHISSSSALVDQIPHSQ